MNRSFQQFFHDLTGKAHVYPPLELYKALEFDTVRQAWRHFAEDDTAAPLGIYVHLPFCERKCSFCYCDTIISGERTAHPLCRCFIARDGTAGAMSNRTFRRHGVFGEAHPPMSENLSLRTVLAGLRQHFQFDHRSHVNVEGTRFHHTRCGPITR